MSDKSLAFWEEVFEEDHITPEDTEPERIKVCYRIVREIARIKGLVDNETLLKDGTALHPDPWTSPLTGIQPLPNVTKEQLVLVQRKSIPLIPLEDPHIVKKYIECLERLVEKLEIMRTYQGRRGIRFLLDPNYTAKIFPPADTLMAWEGVFLDEFLEMQLEKGIIEGQNCMKEIYGLSRMEAIRFAELSRAQSVEITKSTLEQDKAMMILALEKELNKCEEGITDRRSRIQIFKLLTFIKGLHKAEIDDTIRDMVDALATVSTKKKAKQIEENSDD